MADAHQTPAREKPGQTGLNHSPATGQVSADSKRMDTALSRIAEKKSFLGMKKGLSNFFENPAGGEYEIRTREAVTPTRFPSVRHRPLGEFSNYPTFPGVYP